MNAEIVKQLWEIGEIRVLVLTSLLIQTLLTFFGLSRKYSARSSLKIFISILYLSADVVAVYTIGLISNYKCHRYAQETELLALWSSFLLVHLGGPDTITALALEDNELWRRHALTLASQVFLTVLVFSRSFGDNNNNDKDSFHLVIPAVVMFFVGLIKYSERIGALAYASKDNFRDSIMRAPPKSEFINNAGLMVEYLSSKRAHIPANNILFENDSEGKEDEEGTDGNSFLGIPSDTKKKELMIHEAYSMFEMYKPLLAEGFLSLRDRKRSRNVLFSYSVDDAFRIIEIELNLIYDIFYTKLSLLYNKPTIARLLCFAMVVVSSVLFLLTCGLVNHKADIIITFILFVGSMALDLWATIMFILSDWWLILGRNRSPLIRYIITKVLFYTRWARRLDIRRWSNTIFEYNLLKYSFRWPPFLLKNILGTYFHRSFPIQNLSDVYTGFAYVSTRKVRPGLLKFIRTEIWRKAKLVSDIGEANKLSSARGNWVLENDYCLASECLSPWTVDVSYDKSLMIWHLATDICYWTANSSESGTEEYEFCKELSDYMLYLLMWQQSLLSSVVGSTSETLFHHTFIAVKKFMDREDEPDDSGEKAKKFRSGQNSSHSEVEFFKRFSDEVIRNPEDLELTYNLGSDSQDVLFDACRLAKQLKMFGDSQWEITSKVWVELVCYAAINCSPRNHVAQLKEGGELITLVWLFMAHLGIGEHFRQNERNFGRLVIDK